MAAINDIMNFASIIFNFILLVQGPCAGCGPSPGPCAPCCTFNGGPGCGGGPPPPPGLDIDMYIYVAFALAICYGLYRIQKFNSKKLAS